MNKEKDRYVSKIDAILSKMVYIFKDGDTDSENNNIDVEVQLAIENFLKGLSSLSNKKGYVYF